MRLASVLVLAALGCSRLASAEPAYISVGADALDTVVAVAHRDRAFAAVVDVGDEAVVLAVDPDALEAVSAAMHEHHHRCGGFMLHASLEEARAAVHALPASVQAVEYALDRGALVRSVLPAVDPGRILGTIRELSSLPNRHYQSATGAGAATWLRDRWRSFTTRADVTIELIDHGYAQPSVVMTIPGTTRANEVLVIGGHLDSIAFGGKASNAPGADDDASGVATLTEVARVLLAADIRPERTIQFMAYAAEEVGLRGSQAIARDYQRRGVNVIGALQLDMTNYQGSDRDIWLMKDFTNPAQNEFLIRLIETYVGATWGLDACGYACSDHASWYRTGVPASMPFESRMRDRNRAIHTREDTLEVSRGNAEHAAKFARLATAYAIELGKGDRTGSAPAPALADVEDTRAAWALLAFAASLALGVAYRPRAGVPR